MKRKILFVVMLFCVVFASAQDSEKINQMAADEMEKLTKIVTYADQNLSFNKNQIAKLNSLVKDKATEIEILKSNTIEKAEYSKKHKAVSEIYDSKVLDILNAPQKVAFKKYRNKQIPLDRFKKG